MLRRVSVASSLLMLLSTTACEVVADFDPKKLDMDRTVAPVPIPGLDGAVALMPDASTQDGALIGPEEPDASVLTSDAAGLDASTMGDAAGDAPVEDASAVNDAQAADARADSGNDAASSGDISFADAGS